jgi:plastocyanin
MSRARRLVVLAASVGALAILGTIALPLCASLPAKAETVHVTIEAATFSPPEIAAHVGDVVEWSNQDFVLHTATDRGNGFDVAIKPESKASTPLRKAGKISYYCRYHPNMTGVITVNP